MSQAIREMIQRGAFPQALAALPDYRALRNDPDRLYLRALAHAALGELQPAQQCAERGVELEPDAPRFLLLLASVLGQVDPQRAQSLYTEVVAQNPNLPEGHAGLAAIAARRGHAEQAQSLFRTALRANAEHVPTLLGYARLLTDLSRHDEALQYLNRVLARDPSNPDAQALAGRAMMGRGSDDFARRALDNALGLAPRHALALRTSAQLHFKQGNFELAWVQSTQLLQVQPDDQIGLLLAAELLLRSGEQQQAGQVLARLVQINPRHERALLKLADLEAQHDPMQAARRLQASTRLMPNAAKLWGAELALLGGQGQMPAALAEARAWTTLVPEEAMAWNQLAALAEFGECFDEGVAAAERALELSPGQIDSSLVLARAALRRGEPQAALTRLDPLRSRIDGVKRNELERFRGRALLAAGDPVAALDAFHAAASAAALDPHPPALERTPQRATELKVEAADGREIWFLVGAQGSGVDAIGRFFAAQDDCYLLSDRFGPEPRHDLLTERSRWPQLARGARLELARSKYWRGIERLRIPSQLQIVDWLPQLDARMFDVLRVLLPQARFIVVQRDPRDALMQAIAAASAGPAFADPLQLAAAIGAQTRHFAAMLGTHGARVHSLGFEDVQEAAGPALQRLAAQLGRAPFGAIEAIERGLRERGGLAKYLPGESWKPVEDRLAGALSEL